MGYTHYLYQNRKGDQQRWTKALIDIAEIIRHSPVPLGDNFGNGAGPEFTDGYIGFNGRADQRCIGKDCGYCTSEHFAPNRGSAHDLAHETFLVTTVLAELEQPDYAKEMSEWVFSCCKTAQKPYDVVVTACLCRIAECGEQTVHVSSDGEESDWVAGSMLASMVLGRPVPIPDTVINYREFVPTANPA